MNRKFNAFSHGSKVHTEFKFKIRYSLVIRTGRREDVSVEGRAADIDDATTVSAEYDRDGIAKLGNSAVFGVQGHPIVVRWCRRKFRHQGTFNQITFLIICRVEGCKYDFLVFTNLPWNIVPGSVPMIKMSLSSLFSAMQVIPTSALDRPRTYDKRTFLMLGSEIILFITFIARGKCSALSK